MKSIFCSQRMNDKPSSKAAAFGGGFSLVANSKKKTTNKTNKSLLFERVLDAHVPPPRDLISSIHGHTLMGVDGQALNKDAPLVIPMTINPNNSDNAASETVKQQSVHIKSVHKPVVTEGYSKTTYGLQVMGEKTQKPILLNSSKSLLADRVVRTGDREKDTAAFHTDVASRPDEANVDKYNTIPVGEFGAALLRGMGWKDGEALGRDKSGLLEPVQFRQRPVNLGLGAEPSDLKILQTHNKRRKTNIK